MEPSIPVAALICPACRGPLAELSRGRLRCPGDGVELTLEDGIWRLLTSRRAEEIDGFLADYRRLRSDEGWGAGDDAYYRALPFRDTTGRHPEIWRIRAASYRLLLRQLGAGQRVADLGAGNCWLSWRLAEAGHAVAAIDLSDDPADGLGAAAAYPEAQFLRIQATFDRVPIGDGELDLTVFNGSLHYAADVRRTLAEARRLVRPGGRIVIMDTPVYRLARSGERMLRERQQVWRQRYGPDFGAFATAGFLTRGRLKRIGKVLGLRWRVHPLPLGWRWHLAPFVHLALGRREPARFPLIVSRPLDQAPATATTTGVLIGGGSADVSPALPR